MPSITWNENSPAGADSVGLGAGEFRSLKTAVRTGLDAEHVWPAASGDAGVHRLGSGRPYVGAQSLVSSTGTDGRLMQTSDTSRLFHVGSGGTSLIGGATAILAASFPGAVPQRHYWAYEQDSATPNSSGSLTVTFPNSGYSGIPQITLTVMSQSNVRVFAWLVTSTPSSTGFTAGAWDQKSNSAGTNCTIYWTSLGTRVL